MVKQALLVAAVLAGACTDNSFVVQPIVDMPVNDPASPYPIDSLTVSVAHAGSTVDVVSTTFPRGSTIQLSGVPFADDLVMHMTGRFGTSEVAYGRTCKFQLRSDGRIPIPHIFLSRTVKFGELSVRPLARAAGAAITYPDGSGLLLGGYSPDDPNTLIKQVERLDPNTGEYKTLHDILPRVGSATALLGEEPDARVLVIGGLDPTTNTGAQFLEVIDADRVIDLQYDMFPDTFMARVGISATSLSDGRVIAIGGKAPDTGVPADSVVEVSIQAGTPLVRQLRAHLIHARYGQQATRLSDDIGSPVLVTGGLDVTGAPVGEAELFKPLSEDFSPFKATMIVPRSRHQAVRLPDGSVLIVGGVDAGGQPVRKIELFSLDAGFIDEGDLPENAGLVDITATTLPDGRVLLTGGRLKPDGPPVSDAFIARLDPFDGTVDVVPTDRLGIPRAGHQATLLCDGTVLIAGGTQIQTAYERYNPIAEGRR